MGQKIVNDSQVMFRKKIQPLQINIQVVVQNTYITTR